MFNYLGAYAAPRGGGGGGQCGKKNALHCALEAHVHKKYQWTSDGYGPVSVADPGCLSRIPDPDFYPSRISDPGSRIQKQ